VIAPDQRGYSPGARPAGRRSYLADRLTADVVALADAADAERFHVVGHDWGGWVAWALAAWYPDRLFSMTALTTPHPRALLRAMMTSAQILHSWRLALFQLPWLPEKTVLSPLDRITRRMLLGSGMPPTYV